MAGVIPGLLAPIPGVGLGGNGVDDEVPDLGDEDDDREGTPGPRAGW
jgi:hypothetical protein